MFLNKQEITIEEAGVIVSQKLKEQKNVTQFCAEHNLCYPNVLIIKNGGVKDYALYPLLIMQLLEIFFNVKVERVQKFIISHK